MIERSKIAIFIWLLVSYVSLASFPLTLKSSGFARSIRQALYEQEVEDENARHRFDNHLIRRLIVMPITNEFKPNPVDPMFGKLQYGDKASLPSSLGKFIFSERLEVPWIFEVKPVRTDSEFSPFSLESSDNEEVENEVLADFFRRGRLSKVYVSPLDFRAPENFIFLPQWVMNDLGLRPFDRVDVSFLRIKLADLVTIQPLSSTWDDLLERVGDPKSLLEREVNKYSSLTAGSTIFIEIDGERLPLHVKETRAEGGIAVHGVRVQDSDVRVDIDRSVLDRLAEEREKDRRRAK